MYCISLERMAKLLGLLAVLTLMFLGAQAARPLSSNPQPLPSCSVYPGIPGWDCYDPPTHPLPPCDFHHQRVGFDCSGWPPLSHVEGSDSPATTFRSKTRPVVEGHIAGELPPCSQVPGGIIGWNCYDPPTHPLPPCDFLHQRIGIDCSGWPPGPPLSSEWPPATHDVGAVSPPTVKSTTEAPIRTAGHVESGWPPADAR